MRGIFWGTLTGASIAAYTLWDSYSVTHLDINPIVYFAFAAALQFLLMTPIALKRRDGIARIFRNHARETITVGVLSPIAYVLVLFAMQQAPVAIVAPLRESSIIVGALAGWLIFHEAKPVPRIIGACVVAAGISLIAIG